MIYGKNITLFWGYVSQMKEITQVYCKHRDGHFILSTVHLIKNIQFSETKIVENIL